MIVVIRIRQFTCLVVVYRSISAVSLLYMLAQAISRASISSVRIIIVTICIGIALCAAAFLDALRYSEAVVGASASAVAVAKAVSCLCLVT